MIGGTPTGNVPNSVPRISSLIAIPWPPNGGGGGGGGGGGSGGGGGGSYGGGGCYTLVIF